MNVLKTCYLGALWLTIMKLTGYTELTWFLISLPPIAVTVTYLMFGEKTFTIKKRKKQS